MTVQDLHQKNCRHHIPNIELYFNFDLFYTTDCFDIAVVT
jgi:hypothetical protein